MNIHQSVGSDTCADHFDAYLQLFYKQVVLKELDVEDPVVARRIRRALKVVVGAYKKQTVESQSSSILFDSTAKRCAYVIKHCACFTSAVARHFRQFFLSNAVAFDRAFQMQRLNLCCVGGGPATDAVAVARVISSMTSAMKTLTLGVTVIDLSQEWRSTASNVIQNLEKCPELSCGLEFGLEFLQADLAGAWPDSVQSALGAADVITMVYFVSAVNGSRKAKNSRMMLERIMLAARPGAVLFFLDSSKEVHYDDFRSAAHSVGSMQRAYGPHLNEFHTLSTDSIRTFLEAYSQRFDAFSCLSNCFVTCAAWIKTDAQVCRWGRHRQCLNCDAPSTSNAAARKRFARNTALQALFRRRLERLFRGPWDFDVDASEESDDIDAESEYWTRIEAGLCRELERRRKSRTKWVLDDSVKVNLGPARVCRRSVAMHPCCGDSGEEGDGGRFCEKISSFTKWTRKKRAKDLKL